MENQKLEKQYEERIIRILSKDIEGKMKIYPGLTKIKGISWSIANAICKGLGLDKNRKIGSLTDEEVVKISGYIKELHVPEFLNNRKKDPESGERRHLVGIDLELQKEFDVKKLKKIKSYKGYRHSSGLPVRGQKTRSNFRKNKRKAGIKRKVKKK